MNTKLHAVAEELPAMTDATAFFSAIAFAATVIFWLWPMMPDPSHLNLKFAA